jgi:PDDEXK-like domain of unknown function (DUF3799)
MTQDKHTFPPIGGIKGGLYRQIPAISNSDLTEFKNHIFGRKFRKPQKAFDFGSVLHETILEPKNDIIIPDSVDMDLVNRLSQKVKDDRFCKWILQFASKEKMNLFTDPTTDLRCKSKLDLVYKNSLVVDLKTTSQPNYGAFLQSCLDYDYDRQAAFYLDSIGSKRFIFVGIQKKAPYDLFYFDASKELNFIETGRKKYKALLRKWKEEVGKSIDFVPSSWAIETQNVPYLIAA